MTPYPFTSDLWADNGFGEGISLVLVPYRLLILPDSNNRSKSIGTQIGLHEHNVSQTKMVVHEGEREICDGKGVEWGVSDQGSS